LWEPHLDAICVHLEAVTRGEILNLVITIPPGCTKSITVNVMWLAWMWLQQPSLRFLCAANEEQLVIRDAVACRRLIESLWYRERWGERFTLTSDQNVKSWYENDRRGYRTSTTVKSSVVGKKGDILIVDDPNDARKAESEVDRRSIVNWWDHSFFNRVNDARTGRRVIIGQRTHEEDLIGHVLKQGVVHLNLPEEFDGSRKCVTSIWQDWRTTEGELLRPERFGPHQIAEAKRILGSEAYAAQHNQSPQVPGGARFKRSWFKRSRYRDCTDHWRLLDTGEIILKATLQHAVMLDPANRKTKASKKTAMVNFADAGKDRLLVIDALNQQLALEEIVPTLDGFCARRYGTATPPDWAGIEANGFQLQLCTEARKPQYKHVPVVMEVEPEGKSKLVRATPAVILAEQGRIYLPEEGTADWLEDFLDQLCRFTGDEKVDTYTDMVDCLGYYVRERQRMVPKAVREFRPWVVGGQGQ